MIHWESRVAICGHRGPVGESPFETQLAENGRTTAVHLPGGLSVNIRPRAMKRGIKFVVPYTSMSLLASVRYIRVAQITLKAKRMSWSLRNH
jgi:hypothetical protein